MLSNFFDRVDSKHLLDLIIKQHSQKREVMEGFVINENHLKKFSNLSLEELQKIKAVAYDDEELFTFTARYKHREREMKKLHGVAAIRSHPLVFVLSVSFQPEDKAVAVHGTISAKYQRLEEDIVVELFSHGKDDAQFVGTGGDLALMGSYETVDHACIPLRKSSIDVKLKLLDATGEDKDFATDSIQLNVESGDDGYEVVRSESICEGGVGNLTLQYIVIPFGVSCCIAIFVKYRHPTEEDYSFDVSGSIVVKFANTYGSYSSEKCVLFDKQGMESETVHRGECLQLSRCWVALPAYSSLLVDIDLSKSGSDQKIVTGTIKLHPQQGGLSGDSIVLDDYIITADAAWFPADYHWPHHPPEITLAPSEEIEGKDKSSDDYFDDGSSSSTSPQRHQPPPFHAVEIFSVFVGLEKSTAQVYGSAEVLSNYVIVRSIFKRDDKDAFTLSQHKKFIPVLDVSQVFWNSSPLEMKLDIKDAADIEDVECSLAKGYGNWGTHILDDALCYDRQLCSLVRGEHGFAAVHYSIFSKAVIANIKVIRVFKTVSVDANHSVFGNLVTQYRGFDYSSKYHEDCYRSELFRRDENDPVQLGVDCSIPLSRSAIVVPSYSSLVLVVDLSFGDVAEQLLFGVEIKHFQSKTVKTRDCTLHIKIEWLGIME